MPMFAEMSMTTFWIIAMVVFLVIEAVTVGIVSVWFAIGALFAMVTAMLGANLWVQITVFLVVSAIALYFTRPLVKKFVNNKVEPTNADMLIARNAVLLRLSTTFPAQVPFMLTARPGPQGPLTRR